VSCGRARLVNSSESGCRSTSGYLVGGVISVTAP